VVRRIAYIVTHPIQYQAPLLRLLNKTGQINLHVFFLSDYSLHAHREQAFSRIVHWDVPLTDGYSWELLPRLGIGASRQLRPRWPVSGLAKQLKSGRFDAVWVHGWGHIGLRQAIRAAHSLKLPVLLRGESIPDRVDAPRTLKSKLRERFVRGLLRRVAACLCIGSLNQQFYRAFGFPEDRLFSVPYAVDNEWFQSRCAKAAPHREELRRALQLETGRPIVLFAAKFIPVKAPDLLLAAFQKLINENSITRPYLLFVGDGPMRPVLERRAAATSENVRFLGFKNQTELPALYDLCDVFVLPSRFEPWGLAVNEVMNACKPVIISDRVGAGSDLVKDQENGWVFEANNIVSLTEVLKRACSASPEQRAAMGKRSREIIGSWGFDQDMSGVLAAIDCVTKRPESPETIRA
jgi:glycosyltransferase involved in cell wall biosynthesis